LKRSPADNIFSTWEWQSSWWKAYQAGELWLISCRDDQDRLVGLAPWFIQTQPGGERVVRSIGCVDVTITSMSLSSLNTPRKSIRFWQLHLHEQRGQFDG